MEKKPSPHPDWAVKFRRPGTELRCINGRYCLYECRCIYDKEKKRNRKITGKYLGSITEEGGFKPSKKRLIGYVTRFWVHLSSVAGCHFSNF